MENSTLHKLHGRLSGLGVTEPSAENIGTKGEHNLSFCNTPNTVTLPAGPKFIVTRQTSLPPLSISGLWLVSPSSYLRVGVTRPFGHTAKLLIARCDTMHRSSETAGAMGILRLATSGILAGEACGNLFLEPIFQRYIFFTVLCPLGGAEKA